MGVSVQSVVANHTVIILVQWHHIRHSLLVDFFILAGFGSSTLGLRVGIKRELAEGATVTIKNHYIKCKVYACLSACLGFLH